MSVCPECGAALPSEAQRGLCPTCLLQCALDPSLEEDTTSEGSAGTMRLVRADGMTAPLPFEAIGDYELFEEIGHGGMGVIFKARQRSLDRLVAVKLIRSGALASPGVVARFRTEATAAARLQHPNIVAIHEVSQDAGRHFYSMELVPGRSLAGALREGPFAARSAATIVQTVAQAIHFAHGRGVLHRDLKPSNILLDVEDQPHVADFGLAKLLQSDSELTMTGAVLGSPNYMPPEQARGNAAEVGVRSDVYSLGAILYECLTGRPPFTAATPLETMKLLIEQDPVPPRLLNPDIPRDLDTICLKCLQKEPVQRYSSAERLAQDLERWLGNEPIQARPTQVWEHALKWTKRHPARAGLIALGLVVPPVIIALLLATSGKVTRERNLAVQQERNATAAAARAETSERTARERAYAADMYAVFQALAVEDLGSARRLLDEHRPTLAPSEGQKAGVSGTTSRDLRGFEWRVLWQRAQGQDAFAFTNLARPAQALLFTPDGRTLVSGGEDGIHMWDFVERRYLSQFPGPDPGPTRSDIAPTLDDLGTLLASSPALVEHIHAQPGIIDYLDAWGHTNRTRQVYSLAFTPDAGHLLVGSTDLVRSWDFRARTFDFAIPEMMAEVAMPPLGDLFVAGNNQLVVDNDEPRSAHPQSTLLYSFSGRCLVAELAGYCLQPAFSSDGQFVAAGNRTNGVVLWQPSTGEVRRITSGGGFDGPLAFSSDGSVLLVGSEGRQFARLWEVSSKRTIAYLEDPHVSISVATWSPDGRHIAISGPRQTIGIWKRPDPQMNPADAAEPPRIEASRLLHGHQAAVTSLAFSPDGRWLVSAGLDNSIRFWPSETIVTPIGAPLSSAAAAPTMWAASNKPAPSGGTPPKSGGAAPAMSESAPHFDGPLATCAMDPATGCIIGRSGSGLLLYQPPAADRVRSLTCIEPRTFAGFLAGGAGFVTIDNTTNGLSAALEIRRLPDGVVQTRRAVPVPPQELPMNERPTERPPLASPDGHWLIAPEDDLGGAVHLDIYALETGRFARRIPLAGPEFSSRLRVSPDSRWLIATGFESGHNAITIIETGDWRMAQQLRFASPSDNVHSAAIDPTSRFLATGGEGQGSIRVWDLQTGRLLGRCDSGGIHWDPVWSPDGRTLASYYDGKLKLLSMTVFRELATLEATDGRPALGFTSDGRTMVLLTLTGWIETISPPTLAEIDDAMQVRGISSH